MFARDESYTDTLARKFARKDDKCIDEIPIVKEIAEKLGLDNTRYGNTARIKPALDALLKDNDTRPVLTVQAYAPTSRGGPRRGSVLVSVHFAANALDLIPEENRGGNISANDLTNSIRERASQLDQKIFELRGRNNSLGHFNGLVATPHAISLLPTKVRNRLLRFHL